MQTTRANRDDRKERLEDLDRRINAARDTGKPKPRAEKDKYAAMSMAWRMVIELALSVMVGARALPSPATFLAALGFGITG